MITDRKKDMIVTAGGKNVAPQNLENDLKANRAHLSGVGRRRPVPYIAALVTVDPEGARASPRTRGAPACRRRSTT